MTLDLFHFYTQLKDYPRSYLTPKEQQVMDALLDCLVGIIGVKIQTLDQLTKIQLVRDVVKACITNVYPEGTDWWQLNGNNNHIIGVIVHKKKLF